MVRILSGRSGLQLAYLGMGVAAGILTWVLVEHRSNHPNILGYSFEYFLLLLFVDDNGVALLRFENGVVVVATIGLILLAAGVFLKHDKIKKLTGGAAISAGALFGCFLVLELILRFVPGHIVSPGFLPYIPRDSTLYHDAVMIVERENFKQFDRRMVFDGYYFHYRPGIQFTYENPSLEVTNLIQIDEIGFRNRRGTYSGYEQIPYVFLGDSGTIGLQVDRPFSEVFGVLASEQTLNLGIGAQGTWQYSESLERFGVQKRPRIVFVTLFLNDFVNDRVCDVLSSNGLGEDHYRYLTYSHRGLNVPESLLKRIVLSSRACSYLTGVALFLRALRIDTLQSKNEESRGISLALDGGETKVQVGNFSAIRPERMIRMMGNSDWSSTAIGLKRIRTIAAREGSRVVLTYIPQPSAIYYPYFREGKETLYQSCDVTELLDDFGWPKVLASVAREAGIEFLDPREGLLSAAALSPFLYFGPVGKDSRVDSHFGARGHEVFARILYDYAFNLPHADRSREFR